MYEEVLLVRFEYEQVAGGPNAVDPQLELIRVVRFTRLVFGVRGVESSYVVKPLPNGVVRVQNGLSVFMKSNSLDGILRIQRATEKRLRLVARGTITQSNRMSGADYARLHARSTKR